MIQKMADNVLLKVALLILLTVLLAAPLAAIRSLNEERGQSRADAARELARTYTGDQSFVGPVLVLPYLERWSETQLDAGGKSLGMKEFSRASRHVVLPGHMAIEGSLAPQERYRGIFKIPFYTFSATVKGDFAPFDPARILPTRTGARIEWQTPFIAMSVSDLRGLNGSPQLVVEGATLPFAQGIPGVVPKAPLAGGLNAALSGPALSAWQAGRGLAYTLQLSLVGQTTLAIAPIAGETIAHITSPWQSPSFGGQFLAAERTVGEQGFDARWRVSSLVSLAPAQLQALLSPQDAATPVADPPATPLQAAQRTDSLQTFDVALVEPLNVYAMATRAGKYGLLFICLVLLATFTFELVRSLRLHPVQYGLVGLSIALFFLLLLALAEKMAFWMAYAGAAAASVSLLAVYFSAILGGWRRGLGLGAYVAALYGALYGLLASEDNALLLGALLIFGMLALLMLVTRRVDWYAVSGPRGKATAGG